MEMKDKKFVKILGLVILMFLIYIVGEIVNNFFDNNIKLLFNFYMILFIISIVMLIVIPISALYKSKSLTKYSKMRLTGGISLFVGILLTTYSKIIDFGLNETEVSPKLQIGGIFLIAGLLTMFYAIYKEKRTVKK